MAPTSGYDVSPLRQRLAALRRRLYLVATVRGVGWLLTMSIATAVVAGVLDWRWHLPGLVRAVFLVAGLAGAAIIAIRYLFKPLSVKSDDLALALRVEERYPSLNDALASTVQFLSQPADSGNDSASMRREAMRRAMRLMSGLDFNRVVDARGLLTASLAMIATCAVGILLLWIDPVMAKTALLRFANPFGGRDWPHRTQIDALAVRYKNNSSQTFSEWQPITDAHAEIRIGKNYEFQIQGTVKGREIPKQAEIVIMNKGVYSSTHVCDVTLDEDTDTQRFSTKLKPDQVQHTFSFYVQAGDDTSKEITVQVLPPPVLVPLDGQASPQLQLYHPRYTDLPSPEARPPGSGNVEAVLGTSVTLRAKADRPLRAAWIEFPPEDKPVALGALQPSLSARHLVSGALTASGQGVWERVAARLDGDSSRFTIEFLPRVQGTYVLNFEDETGLHGSRTFELRLHSDPAPVVQLNRPSTARDILHVLADAELPLHVLADDPGGALRSVFLLYRTVRTEEPRTMVLYDQSVIGRGRVAPLVGFGALAVNDWKARPVSFEYRGTLSMKSFRHRNNIPLGEGDIIILQAAADDFDDVTYRKQPGVTHEVEIHIVGRNALEIELNREQAKVQQDLMRLREKEREALKLVTEVENKLKKGEKLNEEDLAKLLQAEQTQQQIHERVGNENEGLRADIQRLLQTLKQNHVENSAVRDRMQDVQRELNRLADKELDPIEQRLAEARKQAELGDDKSRAENKAALEKQAGELSAKAAAAAKETDQKTGQALKAETEADRRPQGDAEKDRLNAEAQRLKKEAAELQKKAELLQQQAERARKDAASGAAAQAREQLDDARLHQEEVEKTLNDLLTRLEPWSSTREIKGEANKLLEEQRKLRAEQEELAKKEKDLLGKPYDELTPTQKAELQELQEAQEKIEERTRQLLAKMERIALERADKDPEGARELQEARDQAVKEDVTGQMKQAKENLKQNRIQDAQKNQEGAIKGLQKMVKTLEDRREAELDRLVKKMREAEKQLDDLAVEQELLQKKVKDAQKIADPMEREAELKRLAKEQEKLQQKTQEMLKQLSRLRAERASSALGKAGGEMEEAGGNLSRGQRADEKLDDALDRIDEAQRELEQARQRVEDQLRREQLGRVEETLKRLRDRQESLNKEAARIQTEVQQKKAWSRSLTQGSLKALENNQKDLSGETSDVAKKELTGTPVFAKLVQKSADKMAEASARLKAMVQEPPPVDKLPDEELKGFQQDALHRLDQLLDAIKSEMAALQKNGGGGSGGSSGGAEQGGGGADRGPEGLPPLAQLKLLRAMQEDVNKRTEAFTKTHPDLDKLTEKEKTELAGIRADQHDIEMLLDELRKANAPDGPEGDKP